MARIGTFDPQLDPRSWFDVNARSEGWFDDSLIVTPSGPVAQSVLWINVAGVWKQATTWINDGGTWKVATVWFNDGGTWK